MPTPDEAAWDDPDRAVQVEDDNPEALARGGFDFGPSTDAGEAELHDRLSVGPDEGVE